MAQGQAPASSIADVTPAWRSAATAPAQGLDPSRVEPYRNRVLVLPEQTPDRTPGGLIVPDTAREKQQRGKVLAVGPGKVVDGELIPVACKVGDVVLITLAAGKYTGTNVKLSTGVEATIIEEDDIVAIYREPAQ